MPLLKCIREQTEADVDVQGIDPDESRWRTLTGNARDYPQYTQQRMQEVSLVLYRQNPIARRILHLIRDYVVGEGIFIQAKDPWVQKILTTHWADPSNAWPSRFADRVRDLYLYGEQCYQASVNPISGLVTLSYVSPLDISEVRSDPTNPEIVREVVLKANETTDMKPVTLKVIQVDTNPNSPTFGFRSGDCFFFKINNVCDSSRGIPELFSIAEWIDGFDQFLWGRIERAVHLSTWFWDVLLEGATKEQIQDFLSDVQARPPKRGSIRVHNEKVQWNPISVKLEGQDASEEAALFKNLILGGAGMPDFFFAESGAGGRMALAEQSEPTLKSLAMRQHEVRLMLREIFDFQIDQAILVRKRKRPVNREYSVIMSKISVRSLQRTSGAIVRACEALEKGVEKGWISPQEAEEVFRGLIDQIGIGVDLSKSTPGVASFA
jgi:hypothetical protein